MPNSFDLVELPLAAYLTETEGTDLVMVKWSFFSVRNHSLWGRKSKPDQVAIPHSVCCNGMIYMHFQIFAIQPTYAQSKPDQMLSQRQNP